MMKLLILGLAFSFCVACGIKAPPRPPKKAAAQAPALDQLRPTFAGLSALSH